jgi:hypothetical protein
MPASSAWITSALVLPLPVTWAGSIRKARAWWTMAGLLGVTSYPVMNRSAASSFFMGKQRYSSNSASLPPSATGVSVGVW